MSEAPPGTPAFDRAKWKAWQIALHLVDEARAMMLAEKARLLAGRNPTDSSK